MSNVEKIYKLKVDDLVPYEKNARTHSAEQIDRICRSIEQFGFLNPVLVYKDNVIIAGHGRVMAAKKLGLKTVPCLKAEDLTEEQMKAYVIADNKIAEDAGWDFDILREELTHLQDMDFDISLTGFDSLAELDFDEPEPQKTEIVEDDYSEPVPKEPTAKRGEIYILGGAPSYVR